METSVAQVDEKLSLGFEQIKHYQTIGDAKQQVCEMMNTESLLSELNFNQAEKGRYYMEICLTEVNTSSIKDESEIMGRALEYSGIRHYVFGDYNKAVVAFDASLEQLSEFGLQYRIHRWLGVIHCLNENISLGIRHYEDAIIQAIRYYATDDPQGDAFIFSLHSNVTSAYSKLENFRMARYHAHQALNFAKKISDKSLIATASINEANILINEKKAKQALEILAGLDTLVSDDMQISANYYNILGTAYLQTENYNLSIENFEKSNLLIANNSVLQESMVLNKLAIAEAQYLKGSYNIALETIQKVIDELENKLTQFRSSFGDAYHMKSKCLIAQNKLEPAEFAIKKAIEIKGPFETWKLPQRSTLVTIKAAQYFKSNNEQYLSSLIKNQEIIDSLILDLQIQHRYFEDELNLNEYIYNVYSNNLRIASKLQKEFPSKIDPNLIFKYMETLKSFGLRKERKAHVSGLKIPSDLLNEVSELKYNLIKLQKDRFESIQSDKDIQAIDSAYNITKYNYYAVLDIIEAEFPQYYKGQYQKVNLDLENVQKKLTSTEAIVEYFLSEETIYVIGITKDTLHFISKPKPKDWSVLINEFRNSLSNIESISEPKKYNEVFEMFTNSALRLHELLLKDMTSLISKDIESLKIIPDNELYYIPFQLLLTSEPTLSTYQNLNYLGRSFGISYSESSVYLVQSQNITYDDTYTVIAPNYTQGNGLISLPNSYKSAMKIVKSLKGKAIKSDESAVAYLSSQPSTAVLHFAGHAGIHADPSLSRLMLEKKSIYTADIYQSEIDNQLTILSACNTGNGKFINGRGLQSLSRAFRYAGAQSTIQSLWAVPELQTANLNSKIIFNLNSGMKIQDALQYAQFSLLDNSPKLYSHPFYWAGYVTFGCSDQMVNLDKDASINFLYLGFGCFMVIWLLIFLKEKI